MASRQWLEVQKLLRAKGYGLGSTGPNHDGVDGQPGDLTAAAVLAELLKAANDGVINCSGMVQTLVGGPQTYDRAALETELVRDEGERLKFYRDSVGKRSIGVGRNLDDVGIRADEALALGISLNSVLSGGITPAQSRYLLDRDIAHAEAALDAKLPWWRKLDPVRQRVLLNMCFNMGINTLLGFHNTLGMIERGEYAAAAAGMLESLWARQVGARAHRLSEMMRTGA